MIVYTRENEKLIGNMCGRKNMEGKLGKVGSETNRSARRTIKAK